MAALFAPAADARYRDRRDAGRRLAERLAGLGKERPVVLGLARGGVAVAAEVAAALSAPLDVMVVRKLGAPFQPELGMGAIAEGGVRALNRELVEAIGLEGPMLDSIAAREQAELERRQRLYRDDRPPVELQGRTVILVDDGVATGYTAIAAARSARERGARRVVLAVPVGPPDAAERFAHEVDEFVCLEAPAGFFAVGAYYEHFDQVGDEEVARLLEVARAGVRVGGPEEAGADPPRASGGVDWSQVELRGVEIPADGAQLRGDLRVPPAPIGLVVFAHGSGSSRLSPRNVQVAAALNVSRLATLLFDLLSDEEAIDRHNVFDIPLLGRRLEAATRWAHQDPQLAALPIGYFGASTGAAAALCAAADLGSGIRAVVSRGGRPDLAADRLPEVTAPTLLIVGGADRGVIELNEQAHAALRCVKELAIVPGATHLFEEPGALEQVAALAGRWFAEQLRSP